MRKIPSVRLAVLLATMAIAGPADAASVTAVSGDAHIMATLGKPYIHSRHVGTMPYWGPCYRCTTKEEPEASCKSGKTHVLATWTSSGDSTCGGYESDTFTAYTECSGSAVDLYLRNNSYNPADTTGKMYYNATVPISMGGSYGNQVNMQAVFGGGNSCSQDFDWYPTYAITGDDTDGTFNGTVTFGNYLSPYQYQQSPSFHIIFQNYKLVSVRVCKHYEPTSNECATPPPQSEVNPPVYGWDCNLSAQGWGGSSICNGAGSEAQWIWGASDGATGTSQSGYSVMQATFTNPTDLAMTATMAVAADNYGWVWINGQQVAFTQGFTTPQIDTIDLPPGKDTIDFMVLNYPNSPASDPSQNANPAAGILSITDSSGQPLLSTNSTNWTMIQNPPATPDPSPQSLLSGTSYTPKNCYDGGC